MGLPLSWRSSRMTGWRKGGRQEMSGNMNSVDFVCVWKSRLTQVYLDKTEERGQTERMRRMKLCEESS